MVTRMVKRWLFHGLISAMLLTYFSGASAYDWQAFRVCADPNSMPLSNQEGQGYENRIAQILADDLGVPLEYTWFPQRRGFVRNTLRAEHPARPGYLCDVIIGVPEEFELAITTEPYYRSTYALVFRKNQQGLEQVDTAEMFLALDDSVKQSLRIGIFDQTPAALWLARNHMIKQMVPFPTLAGDPKEYPGQIIERELLGGNIDATILWGPIAGYFVNRAQQAGTELRMILLQSEPGIRFDFAISMAVRFGEGDRKRALEELIADNKDKIDAVLQEYKVPVL